MIVIIGGTGVVLLIVSVLGARRPVIGPRERRVFRA